MCYLWSNVWLGGGRQRRHKEDRADEDGESRGAGNKIPPLALSIT